MRDAIARLRAYLSTNIGRCTTCMRQSMAVAVVASASFAVVAVAWPDGWLSSLVGLLAIGSTALWVLHVAVFAARAAKRPAQEGGQTASDGVGRQSVRTSGWNGPGPGMDRRNAVGVLLRAAGVGAIASLPLAWSSRALAFCGQCTKDDDCGGSQYGWCCKNTAPVNAGYVCNECVKC